MDGRELGNIVPKLDGILPRYTQLIAQIIPHAFLSIVQGDHFITRDNPGAFNHQDMNFYRKNGMLDNRQPAAQVCHHAIRITVPEKSLRFK